MSLKILNNENRELKNTEQQAQSLKILNNKHNELKNTEQQQQAQ